MSGIVQTDEPNPTHASPCFDPRLGLGVFLHWCGRWREFDRFVFGFCAAFAAAGRSGYLLLFRSLPDLPRPSDLSQGLPATFNGVSIPTGLPAVPGELGHGKDL